MKAILAVLTGRPDDAATLSAAYAIGGPMHAHITATHVALDVAGIVHVSAALRTSGVLDEWLRWLQSQEDRKVSHAQSAFHGFCEKHGIAAATEPGKQAAISASFKVLRGDPLLTLIPEAQLYDLIVIGPTSEEAYSRSDIADLLFKSGRPVVVAPAEPDPKMADTIAVAWKSTREAAHAVTAAMPLLERARRVVVLTVTEEEAAASDAHGAHALAELLRWHGIKAEGYAVEIAGLHAPEAMLAAAREHRAGMLVMGAYTHSRARETVFGGFTKRMLTGAPIPVLYCH